ncbi:MAG TPA: hypothetical protein DIW47_11985 [Bacteroidetes bacterium]|nr:hypothetical protein [Bacteroidota bacterium]
MKHIIFSVLLSLFSFTSSGQIIPSSGLIGYWPFSGNANDQSPNGNHGTVNGSTLIVDRFGQVGSAYSFDGSNDHITLPLNLNGQLQNLRQMTFSAFIKDVSNDGAIFSNWKASPITDPFGLLISVDNGKLSATNNTGTGVSSQSPINTSSWTHVVVVFDGDLTGALNRMKLYINGVQVASDSGVLSSSNVVISDNLGSTATNTEFGRWISQFGWRGYFNGKIDDIGIWNRVLTQNEINGLNCSSSITQQPDDQSVTVGSSSQFVVNVSGSGQNYQWQSNPANFGWMNVPTNSTYSGSTTNTLTIANTDYFNHLQPFRLIINNGNCSDTSNSVKIVLNDTCMHQVYDTIVVQVYDSISVSDTLVISVNLSSPGIPLYSIVKVFPNPTNNLLNIEYENYMDFPGYSVELHNTLGQKVWGKSIDSQSDTIDLTSLGGKGLYYLVIFDGTGNLIETRKILLY